MDAIFAVWASLLARRSLPFALRILQRLATRSRRRDSHTATDGPAVNLMVDLCCRVARMARLARLG